MFGSPSYDFSIEDSTASEDVSGVQSPDVASSSSYRPQWSEAKVSSSSSSAAPAGVGVGVGVGREGQGRREEAALEASSSTSFSKDFGDADDAAALSAGTDDFDDEDAF